MIAAALLFASVQGTWALAGTTGTLSGSVTEVATSTPVAGANVTATSPSQTITTTSDNHGRFTFASLIPDTYVVTVQKTGYEPASVGGRPPVV